MSSTKAGNMDKSISKSLAETAQRRSLSILPF